MASFRLLFFGNPAIKRLMVSESDIKRVMLEVNAQYAPAMLESMRKASVTPPGPHKRTGDYQKAWSATFTQKSITLSNPSPQTKRLEYGFVGRDSLGRLYHQPPFPHIRPVMMAWRPVWVVAMYDRIARLLRTGV